MTAHTSAASGRRAQRAAWAGLALGGCLLAGGALAQNYPVTPAQRATAQQVAQAGVPVSELAENAPDSYTIKSGDTLWGLSGMFLKSPWRWPELWGMNINEVRNPHRIYPGQQLVLDKRDGRATLRVAGPAGLMETPPTDTIRVSPRTRIAALPDAALPTLRPNLIEPFLAEPIIVDEGTLERAPRIVAATEDRVMLTRGDRAYARGAESAPLKDTQTGPLPEFRIYRSARPLRDPVTRAVLGYEAQYLGRATLVRGETVQPVKTSSGDLRNTPVPATIDITAAREEMRIGDRLLPEPPRQLVSYVPRAPEARIDGAVVSMYGEAVGMAGQNQVVVINKGAADGLASGHVLAILTEGSQVRDKSQTNRGELIKLPDERNGLMMVFRTFDKLSYALILEIRDGVKVGDRVVNPR